MPRIRKHIATFTLKVRTNPTCLFKNVPKKLNDLQSKHVLSAVVANLEDDGLPR